MMAHSDIELTEAELAEAIIKAKSAKSIRLEHEKNETTRKRKSEELLKPFDAGQLIEFAKRFYFERFEKIFDIDENNQHLVEKLAQYFTMDEDFNVGSYSLNKGIFIIGNVGTGKTELMKFFQKNKKRCYKIVSCNTVSDDYLIYKEELESVYTTPIEKPLHDPTVYFQKHIGFCFDDLGTEENKNAYGNKKNVMADVLMALYVKKDFEKFHCTTNLTKDEIEVRYGTRVVSRLREMFNVFVLTGKDRRKG